MTRARGLSHRIAGLVIIGLAVTVFQGTGCGNSVSGLCDMACDCAGCSDDELDECLDDAEDAEDDAEDEGCDLEFEDYVECLDENLECDDGVVDGSDCSDELEELTECMDEPIIVIQAGNACEQAVEHLEQCGFDLDGGNVSSSCPAAAQCNAQCIVQAPCGAIDGTDPDASTEMVDCINACSPAGPPGGGVDG